MSQNIKPTFIFYRHARHPLNATAFGRGYVYVPSFLNIAEDLNINSEQVQHTLTFFAYGMAAGQLFWGPLAIVWSQTNYFIRCHYWCHHGHHFNRHSFYW